MTFKFKISLVLLIFCDSLFAQSVTNSETNARQILNVRGEIFTTRTNPKSLPLPKEDGAFHFAIYGDRTGGNPAGLKYLRQAVQDTNLMDPDFVMTVGDLIQGYNRPKEWMREMQEYKDIMGKLKMNWFPVAGNHDIYWDFRDRNRPKIHHEANYEEHFGPLWYSFQHKECGFVVLYSDEGNPETGEKGFREARLQNMSPEQLRFVDDALTNLKDCKQVFVFLHHPRWLGGGYAGSNWPEVHKRLVKAGNVKGVFGGHIHHMTYNGSVDGIEYFTLATTGAHLSLDAANLGYLHHFNVVTVRENEFTVATIPVGGVIDPKTFKMDFLNDVQIVRNSRPARMGDRLEVDLDSSAANGYTIKIENPGKFPIDVTLTPQLRGGWQVLPDHEHAIIPAGKSAFMEFHFHRKSETDLGWANFALPSFSVNTDYLHTSTRIRLPEVTIPVDVSINRKSVVFSGDKNRCLTLRGNQSSSPRRPIFNSPNDSARIDSAEIRLHQGPFTIEAWVNPSKVDQSRAVVAKTQSSEYALFIHEGQPQFDIHLDGKYISPRDENLIPTNKWSHVAGVFDGKEARLYINGKLVSAAPASGTRTENELPLFVGADPDGFGNPTREFAGKLDEIRLSKVARYSENFDPAERHLRDSQTILLLHMDQSFGPFLLNDTVKNITVFKSGKAQITTKN